MWNISYYVLEVKLSTARDYGGLFPEEAQKCETYFNIISHKTKKNKTI